VYGTVLLSDWDRTVHNRVRMSACVSWPRPWHCEYSWVQSVWAGWRTVAVTAPCESDDNTGSVVSTRPDTHTHTHALTTSLHHTHNTHTLTCSGNTALFENYALSYEVLQCFIEALSNLTRPPRKSVKIEEFPVPLYW